MSFRLGGRLSTVVPPSVLSLVHALELSGVEGSGGVEAHLGQRMVALGRRTSVWPCREGSGGRCKDGVMQASSRMGRGKQAGSRWCRVVAFNQQCRPKTAA